MRRRSRQDVAALRDGVDITVHATRYLQGRRDTARYASFDYCFNYFQSFHEDDRSPALTEAGQLETSCLQLGFYLASWGMFRGKATLLQHSAKSLAPAVRVLAAAPEPVWLADADDYSPPVQTALTKVYRELRAGLPGGQSQTLVTKTMLGVFGCVPAYDRYFRDAFGAATFGPKSLAGLEAYYRANAEAIDAHRVATIDFATGADSNRRYTRAKVIDMVSSPRAWVASCHWFPQRHRATDLPWTVSAKSLTCLPNGGSHEARLATLPAEFSLQIRR